MEAPPLRVGLAGISAVAGGADGWADERAAVYAFSVDCRNAPVHSFSERFSSALEKHERMRGAGLLPESIAFPSKRRLRNMTDDVDNVDEAITWFYFCNSQTDVQIQVSTHRLVSLIRLVA